MSCLAQSDAWVVTGRLCTLFFSPALHFFFLLPRRFSNTVIISGVFGQCLSVPAMEVHLCMYNWWK